MASGLYNLQASISRNLTRCIKHSSDIVSFDKSRWRFLTSLAITPSLVHDTTATEVEESSARTTSRVSELHNLKEREKGDWRKLTLEEKQASFKESLFQVPLAESIVAHTVKYNPRSNEFCFDTKECFDNAIFFIFFDVCLKILNYKFIAVTPKLILCYVSFAIILCIFQNHGEQFYILIHFCLDGKHVYRMSFSQPFHVLDQPADEWKLILAGTFTAMGLMTLGMYMWSSQFEKPETVIGPLSLKKELKGKEASLFYGSEMLEKAA